MLTGCASAPRIAPRFEQPSTVPIQKAHAAVKSHIEAAKVAATDLSRHCPEAKAEIVALSADLDGALMELQTSEGARVQLDTQLQEQTKKANKLAAHSDKSDAALAAASKKLWWYRLHWWGAWIALTLGVLACGAFAFLKFTGRMAVASAKVGL